MKARNQDLFQDRVNFLETRLKEVEDRLSRLEVLELSYGRSERLSIVNTTEKPENERASISVTLMRKTFHKADLLAGDVGDRIDFALLFHNHLERDVRAFKGAVIIKDLFDQDILRVTLTHELGIKANSTCEWKGGIKYNQFLASHQRLLTVEHKDTAVTFAWRVLSTQMERGRVLFNRLLPIEPPAR